jgi:hypothetical protein
MPRVLATVDESAKAWVESQSDSLDVSEAEVIRRLIEAGRRDESLIESKVNHESANDPIVNHDSLNESKVIQRLDELEQRVAMLEQGKIEEIRAETGVEAVDYTPTDSEGAHGAAVPVEGGDDPNPSPSASSGRGSPPEADGPVRERLRDELPGSGDLLAARVDAILAMRDELRERGEATRDDLLEAVDVDATGYADANSLWKNTVAGRDTLRALDGVERPPTGRSTWKWVGDQEGGVYDPTEEF